MDKSINIKALLNRIRTSEGNKFECDEKAIFEEHDTLRVNKSSLPIKVLTIFGGFLATLAFLGFLLITGLYESEIALITFGIGFIISAILLNRISDKLILDTFSISMYIIGFILLSFGLSELRVENNIISILICLIALSSLFITQNFILSFISILAVSGSFLYLILNNDSYDLIHLYIAIYTLILTYLILNEAKIISFNKTLSQLYNPLRIGLVISLLFGLITLGKRNLIPISENYIWVSSIVMIAVTLYLVSIILKINNIDTDKSKVLIYTLSIIILASTIFSPSILGALVIILLCFMINYKTGLAIGIISLIYFISQYYYDLSYTLLTKSMILFVSGVLFLKLYFLTTKHISAHEKI